LTGKLLGPVPAARERETEPLDVGLFAV